MSRRRGAGAAGRGGRARGLLGSAALGGGEIVRAVAAVLVARTAINGGIRVVYPFLPEIARGLGISLGVLGLLVAARSVLGFAAPLLARLAERHGRRSLMLAGLGLMAAGCLVVVGVPVLGGVAAGFVLVGLGKPAFDVPMQAWFGDRVPYRRRGRVLGLTELTWAGALLVTVPVSGLLITATGWQAPFVLVAALCGAGGLAVWRLMAPDRPTERQRRRLQLDRSQVGAVVMVLLFASAAELLFVVYGAWLERDFGLSVAAIGVFTLVVVAGELTGEGAVTLGADRLGLRRSVLAGLVVSALAYLALGLVGSSLVAAIAVVLVWFVGYEVTIVATVPLMTELSTVARDRLISLMAVAISAGRVVGALAGPWIFGHGGIALAGVVAAACALAAAAVLLAAVRDPQTDPAV